MKLFNILFLLNWIAIIVGLFIAIPTLDLLSFDNGIEAGFFFIGIIAILFFIVAHGKLAVYSPKTKATIFLVVLGFAQLACNVFMAALWTSEDHGGMAILFAFLWAAAVAILSLPFAIIAMTQRSKMVRNLAN